MLFTEEDKTFIIIIIDLVMGYGLRKLMTESPDEDLDWITLSRCYLKSGCSSAMHHRVITRTVRGPN